MNPERFRRSLARHAAAPESEAIPAAELNAMHKALMEWDRSEMDTFLDNHGWSLIIKELKYHVETTMVKSENGHYQLCPEHVTLISCIEHMVTHSSRFVDSMLVKSMIL